MELAELLAIYDITEAEDVNCKFCVIDYMLNLVPAINHHCWSDSAYNITALLLMRSFLPKIIFESHLASAVETYNRIQFRLARDTRITPDYIQQFINFGNFFTWHCNSVNMEFGQIW